MKYFTRETDPMIDFDKVDLKALEMLEIARDSAGIPFIISSHYRTPEYDERLRPDIKDGPHTRIPCSAFDILCSDSHGEFIIVRSLIMAGFKRIGINVKNHHIHVDNCLDKPAEVLFIE